MIGAVPQTSGHTIRAEHIEPADTPFMVEFDAPPYRNVLAFAATRRKVRVMARTPEGALRIARYHHYRGSNHRLAAAA